MSLPADHLQKALALEPHNEAFLLDIGEFLIHYRANSAARELFEVGARTMPGSVRVQFLLAVSYILEDRRSAAVPLLLAEGLAFAVPFTAYTFTIARPRLRTTTTRPSRSHAGTAARQRPRTNVATPYTRPPRNRALYGSRGREQWQA